MLRSVFVNALRATSGRSNVQKCLRSFAKKQQDPSRPADLEPKQAGASEARFGDVTQAFSSRLRFRKATPEQEELRYEPEEPEGRRFRSKTGRRNTQYWYLLQCKQLIKRDKLAEALALFENDMLRGEKLQPEEYNYTVLIGGCGRAGYIKKAFKLYNDMKKRGLEPSDATYTALFNACAESPWKQLGLEQALKLRQELRRKNVPLNAVTHHALLKTAARSGDLKGCFQILREMLQSGQAVTQETFQYLLMCCVEDKQQGFRLALQVWHQMLRVGLKPDCQNYNIVLRAARDCGIGNLALASSLLLRGNEESTSDIAAHRGRRLAGRPSHPQALDVDAFESGLLAESLPTDAPAAETQPLPASSTNGLIISPPHQSITTQQSQLPNLLEPSTCRSNVVALGPTGTSSERLALIGDLNGFLNKMAGDGLKPSIKTLTLLADVAEPSRKSVQSLISVAREVGVKLDVPFFNTLIKKAARAGDLDAAKAVKTLMLDRKLRPNAQTFCCLALACGGLKDGLQLLSDMETCGVMPNCHVFSALIAQAARRLDYAYLRELLHRMHQLQVPPNEVVIKQLEFAAQYPPTYDQFKSKNVYLEKIDGFRGFYKQWLEFMPAQPTPHPWDKYRLSQTEQDGVDSGRETDHLNDNMDKINSIP